MARLLSVFVLAPFALVQFCSAAINWNGNNWALGCDFRGQDLSHQRISSDQCGGLCARTPGCTHFVWSSYEGGTCWMKQGTAAKSDAFATTDRQMVCGVMDNLPNAGSGATINWNGNNWALGCDFRGQDLSHQRISSDQCGGLCARTPGCTHFVWSSYEGGTCWMKQGTAAKSDAFATTDRQMVCGVMDNLPIAGSGQAGSQQSGITTRFWDCCKPSCAWSGKVGGSASFVKSCGRDGNSILENLAPSGCGVGGQAFVCNNQQPWAVNDQLAYGFAAATIPNRNEQQTCCTCYKLDFTAPELKGKSMVVQVVNRGDDVSANQFDLQIPGGGVGMFNGCQAQWGAPVNGWGERYGGVRSESECSQLPTQLRDGCKFRFGWMRGVSNPTMTYFKVACPQELTGKTGCISPN